MRWSLGAVLAVAMCACLDAPGTTCADGHICPEGKVCDDVHSGCVLRDQLESCIGMNDLDPCTIGADTAGLCRDEVCLSERCGDGVITGSEDCEGADLGDALDCMSLGYHDEGTLRCAADCTYDKQGCTRKCGDDMLDPEEQCDDQAFGSVTNCTQLGYYDSIPLACNDACRYDVSVCSGFCGDDSANGNEDCDGADLGDATDCEDLGYYAAGTLDCAQGCVFDQTLCSGRCGDDAVDVGFEQCDGTDLGTATDCRDFGFYDAVSVGCNGICRWDTSACTGFCGDVVKSGPEICDGMPPSADTCVTYGFDAGTLTCSSFCSPGFSSCARYGWSVEFTEDLSYFEDVFGFSDSDVHAVGQEGIYHWDGTSWSITLATGSVPYLSGVWGSAADDVWAVGGTGGFFGNPGIGYLYHYDGADWTLVADDLDTFIDGIWGTSSTSIYAAGKTQIRHYDGTSWSTAFTASENLWEIHGTGPDDIWAVGGTVVHWDGNVWSEETISAWEMLTVWAFASDDVWVAGKGGRVYHYDGSAWSETILDAFEWVMELRGWAPDKVFAGTTNGSLWVYDGAAWAPRDTASVGILYDLTGFWGPGPSLVFGVGGEGGLYRYPGYALDHLSSPTSANLRAVWGSSAFAVAVGDGGSLIQWDGTTWTVVDLGVSNHLTAVWGSGPTDVHVVGSGVGFHFDGSTWSAATTLPVANYYDIWGASSTDVYAVGPNTVFHYDGLGWSTLNVGTSSTWQTVTGSGPDDVYVIGTSQTRHWNGTVWAAAAPRGHKSSSSAPDNLVSLFSSSGSSTIRRFDGTTDEEITPASADITIGANLARFRDVYTAGPSDVYGVTDFGTFFHFDGVNWTPLATGVSGSLNAVSGLGDTIFVVGDNGTILRLLRDAAPTGGCTTAGIEADCADGWDGDCDLLGDDRDPDCIFPSGVCWSPIDVSCGSIVAASTIDGGETLDYYACASRHWGPERVFRFVPTTSGTARVTITALTTTHDIIALGENANGACDALEQCIAATAGSGSTKQLDVTATADIPIVFVVDSAYDPSDFTFELTCL